MSIKKRTLEELENNVWPSPDFHSHLVETVHQLRKKPIDEFSIKDFRIVLSQGEGLQYLMPLAIEILEHDPFAEGDLFPGDLLISVIKNKSWLMTHKEMMQRIMDIGLAIMSETNNVEENIHNELDQFLRQL